MQLEPLIYYLNLGTLCKFENLFSNCAILFKEKSSTRDICFSRKLHVFHRRTLLFANVCPKKRTGKDLPGYDLTE